MNTIFALILFASAIYGKGGYFSYTDNGVSKCIFYSPADKPKVIGTISFDSTYNKKTATLSLTERDFTTTESDLYSIRNFALKEIKSDTFFKTYKNTDLNLIPLINGKEKKVYVLTGPKKDGVVIIGNDYLLTFDKDNKFLSKKRLHNNIITISYGEKTEGVKEVVGAMHTHLPETGDFITATDICTLMLYEKLAKWKTHNVISKKYLNIWNCQSDELVVVPMKTIHKMNKGQKKQK
jgi:hypothetical protein